MQDFMHRPCLSDLQNPWSYVGLLKFCSDVQGVFERCQPDLELMEEVQAPSAQICLCLSTMPFSCAGLIVNKSS